MDDSNNEYMYGEWLLLTGATVHLIRRIWTIVDAVTLLSEDETCSVLTRALVEARRNTFCNNNRHHHL